MGFVQHHLFSPCFSLSYEEPSRGKRRQCPCDQLPALQQPACTSDLLGIGSLGLQIAQSRYHLRTLDPKVGTICILGALGEAGIGVRV